MKKFLSIILVCVLAVAISVPAFATTGSPVTLKTGGDHSWNGSANSTTINVPAALDNKMPEGGAAPTVGAGEGDAAKVYYVELSWTVNSTLTYTVGSDDYVWTVYTQKEEGEGKHALTGSEAGTGTAGYARYVQGEGDWTGNAQVVVTLKNWSNVPVDGAVSWAAAEAGGNVQEALTWDTNPPTTSKPTIQLASAVGTESTNGWQATSAQQDSSTVTIGAPTGGVITADQAVIGTVTVVISEHPTGA